MANILEYNPPYLANKELEDNKTPDTIQKVSVSDDVFDFIGDWILKDFLEHETG